VTLFRRVVSIWREDGVLRRIIRNTGFLFSGSTLSMALAMLQSILAARLLGVAQFGLLGMVTSFASSVNRLLSFRIGELVVKYGGQYLAQGRKDRAAATVKAAALTEAATSLSAYLLLLALAPLAATYIIKDAVAVPLIRFYALALLANFAVGTSTAVLQVGDHFRTQAALGVGQSLLTASWMGYAFLTHGSLWMALSAYLAGKIFYGMSMLGFALYYAPEMMGREWMRAPLSLLPPRREFWVFAFSRNFSGTVNLVTRDSELLWLGFFLPGETGKLAAGYYKTALAVINLALMPINPFIATTFPELSRAVGEKAWGRLRVLLKRLTLLSAAWTGTVSLALIFGSSWLIAFLYGEKYTPAAQVTLVLLVGYAFANILYWNRPLLLSLGMPVFPLKAMTFAGAAKILLGFFLVPRYGYLAQAALLSAFFITSIGVIVWKGIREIEKSSGEPFFSKTRAALPERGGEK